VKVQVTRNRQVGVVRASGRLTLGDSDDALLRRVMELLDDGDRRIVLDLDGLTILDSAGVGEIVRCYKTADENGAVLKIALASEGLIHHLFKRSGLDHALELFENEDEAVASFF